MLLAIENFWPPFSQTCLPLLFCRLFHRGGQLEKPSLSCLRRYAPLLEIRLARGIERTLEKGRKNSRIFLKDRGFSNPLFFDEEIFKKREREIFFSHDRSFFMYLIIISFKRNLNDFYETLQWNACKSCVTYSSFQIFLRYVFFLRCKCS